MTVEELPRNIQRLIPKSIEKGIFYRLYPHKDGSVTLIWWIKVWKNGKLIRQSTKSERYSDAVDLKRKLIAEIEAGRRRGGDVDQVRLKEILDDYVSEAKVADATRAEYGYTKDAYLTPLLGNIRACKLDTDRLKQYRQDRVAGIIAKKRPETAEARAAVTKSANTTVNRDFALLRAAMNHATRRTPPKVLNVPYFPMEREDNARQGFLEHDKYVVLRDSFRDPAVRLLFIVDYSLGCRCGELRKMEWSMVDLDQGVIRLPGRITKNRKPRTVPVFDGDMMDALRAALIHRNEYHSGSPWVFARNGEQIGDFRDEWRNACERAGCQGLMFHDLRRTAVRNMTRIHGLDRTTAKKISGHLTDSMFSRYDIVDEEDIKAAKRKVDMRRTIDVNPSVGSTFAPELLERLARVPAEKLNAILALLQA